MINERDTGSPKEWGNEMYYEQFYTYLFHNLGEMDKFSKNPKLSQVKQEDR